MKDEMFEIEQIIQQHPDGVTSNVLMELLASRVQQRTLQRRLNLLVKSGKIIRIGHGRGTFYKAKDQEITSKDFATELTLSKKSLQIQDEIRQPVSSRQVVRYQHSFLENYQPNETYYLTQTERDYLFKIGAQNNGDQPAGTFARKILDRFLIDLSWNSSRLEGNTYSLLETEKLIQDGGAIQDKTPTETQMILNHKAAIEFLVESGYDIKVNKFTICNVHALLAENLLSNPDAYGRTRSIIVGIGNSKYQPLDVPQLIADYFEELLLKASQIQNAFEQALFLMIQLPYLQPFEDVNKRVSRLCANIPFIKSNFCPISFIDVPKKTYVEGLLGIYEFNKIELLKEVFIWAYERSTIRYTQIRQTIGEPDLFRMRYRNSIYEAVNKVVTNSDSKLQAVETIRNYANQSVARVDQPKFIELVEIELMTLHEGKIAKYYISPNQFKIWQDNWN